MLLAIELFEPSENVVVGVVAITLIGVTAFAVGTVTAINSARTKRNFKQAPAICLERL